MWRNAGRFRSTRESVQVVSPSESVQVVSPSVSVQVVFPSSEEDSVTDECDEVEAPVSPEFAEESTRLDIEIPAETITITRRTRGMGKLYDGPVEQCNKETYDQSKCRNLVAIQRL